MENIKQYNFKAQKSAPEGDFDLKKFMKDLKWELLVQVGYVLVKEGDIKYEFTEEGCTATLDFFVDRTKKDKE